MEASSAIEENHLFEKISPDKLPNFN